MKNLMVILLLLFALQAAASDYCEIFISNSISVDKVQFQDEGQRSILKDVDGNKVDNLTDALEIMESRGYEFVTTYQILKSVGMGKDEVYTVFLLRKLEKAEKP